MNKTIDLHVHSTASDGTFTPTELVAEAKRCGLSAFALTDHDTVDGISEALAAGEASGLEVIPGVELSTEYNETEIHVVGLFIDPANTELQAELAKFRDNRNNRNLKMIEKLQEDVYKRQMQEIINYRSALFYALDKIATISDNSEEGIHKLPLSVRLIKEMHKILLDNVRGKTKTPGEFKTEQNYIGSINEITFTPLSPELTLDYMTNLENYIHYDEVDLLVQAALIHCQFEMIHPFKDGNGRIGRLLIPLRCV